MDVETTFQVASFTLCFNEHLEMTQVSIIITKFPERTLVPKIVQKHMKIIHLLTIKSLKKIRGKQKCSGFNPNSCVIQNPK